jgi:adenine deaminase
MGFNSQGEHMIGHRKDHWPSRQEMKDMLSVARGETSADLVIKNVTILDLVNGGKIKGDVALCGHYIAGVTGPYKSKKTIDGKGLVIVPGFIDGHLHIESSLMNPLEFERVTLPLGTTSAVCDPHEITNVLGAKGFEWFLNCAEVMNQNLYVQVSSCIPSLPGFETNGADFTLDQMVVYRANPHVLGLAEMMNFPGVVNGVDEVLDKLDAFHEMALDGHSPLVRGKTLDAYLCGGIRNCHETILPAEGLEKLSKGMSLAIREGTVAKNLDGLAGIVSEFNSSQCFLCTDDRNPKDIFEEGHINYLVRRLIQKHKLPLHVAYRLSSFSTARHYGLRRSGLIAPGFRADFILLSDPKKVQIHDVYIGGKKVRDLKLEKTLAERLPRTNPPLKNSMKRPPVSSSDMENKFSKGIYNVIGVIPDQIITQHLKVSFDGQKFSQKDVLPLCVIERHGKGLKPSMGLVKGMGLEKGAIASSVAHDSHNIIVVGTNAADMAAAVNALIEAGGGFCVVEDGEVKAILPLPVAGLMSLASAEKIASKLKELKKAFTKIGVELKEPFLQMAFLSLPVIPSLKLSDLGLVDVTKFSFIELKDQAGEN